MTRLRAETRSATHINIRKLLFVDLYIAHRSSTINRFFSFSCHSLFWLQNIIRFFLKRSVCVMILAKFGHKSHLLMKGKTFIEIIFFWDSTLWNFSWTFLCHESNSLCETLTSDIPSSKFWGKKKRLKPIFCKQILLF